MLAFEQDVEGSLVERLIRHLRTYHADALGRLPDDGLEEMVSEGLARARRHGITWESSLTSFVALMFEIAPNFDEHPAIHRVLTDVSLPPDQRVEALQDAITDAEWEEAAEQYDPSAWFPDD